jgi:hypothetical protein
MEMTKQELTDAYHTLANEALKDRIRFEKRREMIEMFDTLWGVDWEKKRRTECCEECSNQEAEYGV